MISSNKILKTNCFKKPNVLKKGIDLRSSTHQVSFYITGIEAYVEHWSMPPSSMGHCHTLTKSVRNTANQYLS